MLRALCGAWVACVLGAQAAPARVDMLVGLVLHIRRRAGGTLAALDIAAMLAVLQWAIVLAMWGLLPLRLWS